MMRQVEVTRWAAVLSGIIAAAAAPACYRHVNTSRPVEASAIYPTGEASLVYAAVLDTLFHDQGESPPIIVLWDSVTPRAGLSREKDSVFLRSMSPAIEESTIRSYETNTMRSVRFNRPFTYSIPLTFVDETNRSALLDTGQHLFDSLIKLTRYPEHPFWLGFDEHYHDAWGLTSFSGIGFNRKQTQALLQVRHGCGSSCMSVEIIFLQKRSSNWQVHGRFIVDEYSGEGSHVMPRRYIGPDKRFLAIERRLADSISKAEADSIRRWNAPRLVRGTVFHRIAKAPLKGLHVIAHVAGDSSRISLITDSAGHYRFKDLPLGGTMLEVRCANGSIRYGPLAAPGLYVYLAIDTVFDIVVQDLRPCWRNDRIYRLVAGWTESETARNATYPTEHAQAVYNSVVRFLLGRNATFSATVLNATRSDTLDMRGLNSKQLEDLVKERTLDAETLSDFLEKARKSEVFRPNVGWSSSVQLISPQEIAFIAEQVNPYEVSEDVVNSDGFWSAFRKAYPRSRGLFQFTQVGFNRRATQAMLRLRRRTGEPFYNVRSETLLLNRIDGHWRVIRHWRDEPVDAFPG